MLKKRGRDVLFFLLSLALFWCFWQLLVPKEDAQLTKRDFLAQKPQMLTYVAIGDSLTQGVGDTTNQGGFVPMLSESLKTEFHYQVTSSNYGVSGNTSQQILDRMTKDKAIQAHLKEAKLMTLTVGGNDVLAVIRKDLATLKVSSFTQPAKAYQKRLKRIIQQARKENPQLPIYIVGIYNPFYVNFPELTAMQDIVDKWNQATEEVVAKEDRIYFVPINDALYKGFEGQETVVAEDEDSFFNDALFEGDHFHPNYTGYQLMSHAIMEKISETKSEWESN